MYCCPMLMQAQSPAREGINKLKEDISNFKQEMLVCATLVQGVSIQCQVSTKVMTRKFTSGHPTCVNCP